MNDEVPPENPPPAGPDSESIMKIVWLLVAFVPSLAMLLLGQAPKLAPIAVPIIIALYFICCFAAGLGLVKGMKSVWAKFFVGFLLIGFFLAANLVIVVWVSCSQMGPI